MASTICSHEDLYTPELECPISTALADIVNNDGWIWENNPIAYGYPSYKDDYGFEAVNAKSTRDSLRAAIGRFQTLFNAINGEQPANYTRAKVTLTGIIVSINITDSPILAPSVAAAGAFYRLCESPGSEYACATFLYAHTVLTMALIECKTGVDDVTDAWHSTFAYHGK